MGPFDDTSADRWMTVMHWGIGLLTLLLLSLHIRNRGRSGPIAAFLFVLFGPVLAVGLTVIWIISNHRRDAGSVEVYGIDLALFFELMLGVGILAAVIGAAIHGYLIREELRAYREFGDSGWLGRLRTGMGPSPAFTSLGLKPTATLEDIERAYRELAKRAHPDGGGSAEKFKRLQTIYEQARRQALRRRRPAPPSTADSDS